MELEQYRRPKNISQDQGPNTNRIRKVGWETKTTTETEMEANEIKIRPWRVVRVVAHTSTHPPEKEQQRSQTNIQFTHPLNILTALSASASVANTTVPKPLDLLSGPRATSARRMVPACLKRSLRSCHWVWKGSCWWKEEERWSAHEQEQPQEQERAKISWAEYHANICTDIR